MINSYQREPLSFLLRYFCSMWYPKFSRIGAFLSCAILLISCSSDSKMPPIDNAVDLDGTLINDSSLKYPEKFLLSVANPNPSSADLNRPVVIAAHGFTATTYEWSEFRDFSKGNSQILCSQVLLGAHGRDYNDFIKGTWLDWQAPIIAEYNALRNLGYQSIYFAGSSTGCPLILEMLQSNRINSDRVKGVFFVDPLVIAGNKLISLVNVVGPVLQYSAAELSAGENGHWYKYRPYQALEQLNDIMLETRHSLENTVTLSNLPFLKIYKSNIDDTADPLSAVFYKKGLKLKDNAQAEVVFFESNLHVMTRLWGRKTVSDNDRTIQNTIFNDIIAKAK